MVPQQHRSSVGVYRFYARVYMTDRRMPKIDENMYKHRRQLGDIETGLINRNG
jgi:hypothetical protein